MGHAHAANSDGLQHPPPQHQLPPFHNRLLPYPSSTSNHPYHLAQRFLVPKKTQTHHKLLASAQPQFALPERGMYQVRLRTNMLHQARYFLPEVAIVNRAFAESKGHFLGHPVTG